MVEAAGVEPDIGVENAQLIDSEKARIGMTFRIAKSTVRSLYGHFPECLQLPNSTFRRPLLTKEHSEVPSQYFIGPDKIRCNNFTGRLSYGRERAALVSPKSPPPAHLRLNDLNASPSLDEHQVTGRSRTQEHVFGMATMRPRGMLTSVKTAKREFVTNRK